jgi:hypothetical protein
MSLPDRLPASATNPPPERDGGGRSSTRVAPPQSLERGEEIITAASSCPAPECSSLVVEYRAAGSVRNGHPEDWDFKCSRCGLEFMAAQDDLIFQSAPQQWLSPNTRVVPTKIGVA